MHKQVCRLTRPKNQSDLDQTWPLLLNLQKSWVTTKILPFDSCTKYDKNLFLGHRGRQPNQPTLTIWCPIEACVHHLSQKVLLLGISNAA
ncbi:unnamed protein product [Boreogadus saida]